jgi:hypothetical protein
MGPTFHINATVWVGVLSHDLQEVSAIYFPPLHAISVPYWKTEHYDISGIS